MTSGMWYMEQLSKITMDLSATPSNCCMFGIRLPRMKLTRHHWLDPLCRSTAITPSVLMAVTADTWGPNRWYTVHTLTFLHGLASLIHPNQKFFATRAHPCRKFSPQCNASLLCYFLYHFPGEPMPCKQSTHSGCWDFPTVYIRA